MEPSDLEIVRLRMRRRYEVGRLRRALVVLVPVLALASLGWRIGGDARGPMVGGTLLAMVSVAFLWRGERPASVLVPAMLAGVIPFACALWAHCAGALGFGVCAAACFGGSVFAGLLVARVARRSGARGATWAYAATLTILTGSLGCACVGAPGILGLVSGVTVMSLLVIRAPR